MAYSSPASFLPPPCALRTQVGYRRSLEQAHTQEINRVHELLERANMPLAAVATDVLGKSGRAMLQGLVAGDHDPEALAERAQSGHHGEQAGNITAKTACQDAVNSGRFDQCQRVLERGGRWCGIPQLRTRTS